MVPPLCKRGYLVKSSSDPRTKSENSRIKHPPAENSRGLNKRGESFIQGGYETTIRSCIYVWSDRSSTANLVIDVDLFVPNRRKLFKFQPKQPILGLKWAVFGWYKAKRWIITKTIKVSDKYKHTIISYHTKINSNTNNYLKKNKSTHPIKKNNCIPNLIKNKSNYPQKKKLHPTLILSQPNLRSTMGATCIFGGHTPFWSSFRPRGIFCDFPIFPSHDLLAVSWSQ